MRFMKRQRYAIASEILYAALSGAKKSHLMYSCYLDHKRGEKYIKTLLKKGLLKKKEDQFHTTKKGIQFIETYQKLEHIWDNNLTPKIIQRTRNHKKRRLGFALSLA